MKITVAKSWIGKLQYCGGLFFIENIINTPPYCVFNAERTMITQFFLSSILSVCYCHTLKIQLNNLTVNSP